MTTKTKMFWNAGERVAQLADRVYSDAFAKEYARLVPDGSYIEYASDRAWEAGTAAAGPYDRQARAWWDAAKAVR